MKNVILLSFCFLIVSCNQADVERFAFQKTLEHGLTKKCGGDEACVAAVEKLTPQCMEKADWKSFVNSKDDEKEKQRFMTAYYSCIVDQNGAPYFRIKNKNT